jgi:hypothetical protein
MLSGMLLACTVAKVVLICHAGSSNLSMLPKTSRWWTEKPISSCKLQRRSSPKACRIVDVTMVAQDKGADFDSLQLIEKYHSFTPYMLLVLV